MDEGKWRDIHSGKHGPAVSHLMFTDDLLLLGEANEKNMDCVVSILNQFCDMLR